MSDMQYVMELVNSARAAVDLAPLSDLPTGIVADGDKCPLARALPGNPLVQSTDVIWETFPSDQVPWKIAAAWVEKCQYIGANGEANFIVNLPRELRIWVREFDEEFKAWERYRG